MAQFAKRMMDKFEAMDFTAGKYHPRRLAKQRYNQHDLLDYLNNLDDLLDEALPFEEQRLL